MSDESGERCADCPEDKAIRCPRFPVCQMADEDLVDVLKCGMCGCMVGFEPHRGECADIEAAFNSWYTGRLFGKQSVRPFDPEALVRNGLRTAKALGLSDELMEPLMESLRASLTENEEEGPGLRTHYGPSPLQTDEGLRKVLVDFAIKAKLSQAGGTPLTEPLEADLHGVLIRSVVRAAGHEKPMRDRSHLRLIRGGRSARKPGTNTS